MKKKVIIMPIAIILLLGVGFAGGMLYEQSNSKNDTSQVKAPDLRALGATGDLAEGKRFVLINQGEFAPKEMTIPKGTTVQWKNIDSVQRELVFDVTSSLKLSNQEIDTNGEYTYQFKDKGELTFHLASKPSYVGKITVTD